MMIGDSDRGALDPVAAPVREDVVADASHVAAAEQLPERIVVAFLHCDDPHVDLVLAHCFGEHAIELLSPDGAEAFPPVSCFEVRLCAEVANGEGEARRDERVLKDGASQRRDPCRSVKTSTRRCSRCAVVTPDCHRGGPTSRGSSRSLGVRSDSPSTSGMTYQTVPFASPES